MDNQRPADIPPKVRHLIHLNNAYPVLICQRNECRKAVQPHAFSEHLRVQHETPLRDRERVQEYVSTFNWDYNFSTIKLPRDGSSPQPIIPVVDGLQCTLCQPESSSRPFTSISEKRMRVHRNVAHQQKGAGVKGLFRKVRLQSWFQDHRQRYWVVDESQKGESRDQGVGIKEEENSVGEDEDTADSSTNRGDDVVDETVVQGRDEEVAGEVGNGVGIEVVVGDG